jgi:4-hydroxy-4-methyl-2-oxoglutarate aldolase
MEGFWTMDDLAPTGLLDALQQLDTCSVANAIETFDVRLRNEGFTDGSVHCLFADLPPVAGYAVTARIRASTPPPVGHVYYDRTDWWNYIATVPSPRFVVVQDIDDRPGAGAFLGEVHANILRALECSAYLTNGAVRDLPAVRQTRLQLIAGSTIASHGFTHMVDFGGAVTVAGLPVTSGTLLLADCHGVISIPEGIAGDVPRIVAEMRARERRVIELCRAQDFSLEGLRSVIEGYRGGANR